jgi:prepilin-type N-terminal cleavage/methylation domain-containing protein
VASQQQHVNNLKHSTSKGLTIIEVLVALVLLGILSLIASGLVIPLRLSQDSGVETKALTYGRSYLELVKSLWLDPAKYTAITFPTVTGANPAIKLPLGWSITPSANRFTSPTTELSQFGSTAVTSMQTYRDTLREVIITVTPPNGKVITLRTIIARP